VPPVLANTMTENQTHPYYLESRFVSRWLQANKLRLALLEDISRFPLRRDDFARVLQNETEAGRPLNQAMRRVRNLVVASLIKRDLEGLADLDEVVTCISEFADFVIQTHLQVLHQDMLTQHGRPVGEESGMEQQLIVLGMGKLGGRELNISSDIDLIFTYAEDGETVCEQEGQRTLSNHEFFSRLGKKLIAAISEIGEDGFSFRVDMALRPNGSSGPLVASFAMVEEYFLIQGREWERYAWVKARAITGNADDIALLDTLVRPFVYRRYLDYGAIDSMRSMHAQIRAEVVRQETRHPERSNNIKLGRGGIREIEFLSQVFQLIRGGRDASLRERSTRITLRTLAAKGILEADIVKQLLESYTFLRNLEHRLQYLDDAQTHSMPAKEDDIRVIANMMRYPDVASLMQALQTHRSFVAEQFDAIFKDKQSAGEDNAHPKAFASNLATADEREVIEARLSALHFEDIPEACQRLLSTWQSPRLQSLPESSRNKLFTLVGMSLEIIARQPQGQLNTLKRLLDFMEAIARRASYLALLSEYPHALERVIRMMHASDWAAKYLSRHPILLDELLDSGILSQTPDWQAFSAEVQNQLAHDAGDTERQMETLRELHHAQLFRLLTQDLEGQLSVEHLADALSKLADIIVETCIHAAWQTIATRHREQPQFAVIAYGKLGGKELGYASDLDIIFLYEDEHPDAPANYAKLAQRFITWMTCHTPAGILFDIDIALRPDGASGLLVSSLAAFERYQEKSAWLWEHQALTRARYCAGDARIGASFEHIRERILRQTRNADELKAAILSMRKKMRDAHPNRSVLFDLKHDAGGMIDIEFLVQYLVLSHAHTYPELTANLGNIALLLMSGKLGLIPAELAQANADAYRKFRKLQHRMRLQGEDKARSDPALLQTEITVTQELWRQLFGQPLVD
jgi:glutamate-ammonia-ligase adenylyltransferase